MNRKLSDSHLTAWRLFITSHALLIDLIDGELAEAQQIPLHWYGVLIELANTKDHRLRMSELAERVVLSRSGLTRLVDRLEQEDLLRRERSQDDGRGSYAVLTEKGVSAVHQAWPVYSKAITRYFAKHLTQEQAEILSEAFSKMLDEIEKQDKGKK